MADESLLSFSKSAETMPKGAMDFVEHLDYHGDKGSGTYQAIYSATELEYGVTDRFTVSAYILGQSVKTQGIIVDGYIPGNHPGKFEFSGFELSGKYNFLSVAGDDFGLSQYFSYTHKTKDPHSGQDKNVDTFELKLLAQKYFLDGQLIWLGNLGLETTRAQRKALKANQWAQLNSKGFYTEDEVTASGNPDAAVYEWPTHPEMEIGLMASTGLSYRFANNWFIGAEYVYENESETEVGIERYSHYAGPTLHYGGQQLWMSLGYLREIKGGGEAYDEQDDTNLHLIERTKDKYSFKIGYNF
jgi:opacity protein-like surface antigen